MLLQRLTAKLSSTTKVAANAAAKAPATASSIKATTTSDDNMYVRYVSSKMNTPHSVSNIEGSEVKLSQKVKVCYLDLRGFGVSILERLLIEECILKHDTLNRNWILCGTHTSTPHRYLNLPSRRSTLRMDDTIEAKTTTATRNDMVAIVMGIGGKPNELLNINNVQNDDVSVIKRFTGGGTVVLDHNSIWTTVIHRPTNADVDQPQQPLHHPRPIMEYTANTIYQPIFERLATQQQKNRPTTTATLHESNKTLVVDTKSCSFDNSGRSVTIPLNHSKNDHRMDNASSSSSYTFALRENDYVLNHTATNVDYKMGGNAQAITKDGFLHHTSFLWDYEISNMEDYLLLPQKRPEYRRSRDHTKFLMALQRVYPSLQKHDFFSAMYETCQNIFDLQRMTFIDGMNIINAQGGIQTWYETKSRTKII